MEELNALGALLIICALGALVLWVGGKIYDYFVR